MEPLPNAHDPHSETPGEWIRLARYLIDDLETPEQAEVRRWLDRDERRAGLVASLRRVWGASDSPVVLDVESALQGVRTRIDSVVERGAERATLGEARSATTHPVLRCSNEGGRIRWWCSRAVLRSMTLSGMAIGCVTAIAIVFGWHPAPNITQTYRTAPGQQSTVRLPDGTRIILAPVTSVILAQTSTATSVTVTGEVYFDVAPVASRQFLVQTTHAQVHVLGTRFSVRQYADEGQSRIVVENGRVMVHKRRASGRADAPAVVSSREVAVVGDSGMTIRPDSAIRDYISWTHGMLTFNRVALRDVVVALSRAYDADIRIADTTLAKHLMYLDISLADDALPRVIERVCQATDAHFTRDGIAYVLRAGPRMIPSRRMVPPRNQYPHPEHDYGR